MKQSLTGFYSVWLLIVLIFGSIYPPTGYRKVTKEADNKTDRKIKQLQYQSGKQAVNIKSFKNYPINRLMPGTTVKQPFINHQAPYLKSADMQNGLSMQMLKHNAEKTIRQKKPASLIIVTSGRKSSR